MREEKNQLHSIPVKCQHPRQIQNFARKTQHHHHHHHKHKTSSKFNSLHYLKSTDNQNIHLHRAQSNRGDSPKITSETETEASRSEIPIYYQLGNPMKSRPPPPPPTNRDKMNAISHRITHEHARQAKFKHRRKQIGRDLEGDHAQTRDRKSVV